MKTLLPCFFLAFSLTLLGNNVFGQPTISYSPSSNTLAIGTAFNLSPTSTGVASFAFGPGTQLTGATLNNPWGMAIDPLGHIYVTNYDSTNLSNSSISEYQSTGAYLGTFATPGNLAQPSGITFDAFGNAYVLNYNRTNNGLGNDHGNGYVDQYNSSGVFKSTIIQGLGSATGITIDASNNLYIAMGSYNNGFNTVSQYNTSGALAFSIATGHTSNPVAVAVDGSYNIYVLDKTNKNVTKYNSSGAYVSTPITGLSNPNAIYIDGAGNIFVGDSGTHTVTVYNSSGTLLTSISGLTDPRGIVSDSKGNLYVSDYTNNTVTKYPPIGGYFLSGTLPQGLSFSSTTGVFSGTPVTGFAAKQYIVTAYNASRSVSFTETLSCPSSAPTITYDPFSINVYTTNSAITPDTAKTTGSPSSYSISATLPTGLSFSTTTGIISGTPTATSAATIYTVTATNAFGSATTNISIACVIDDYWTGKQDSLWTNKQNWSIKQVPGPTDLASIGVIKYSGPDPVVTTSGGSVSVDFVTFGAKNSDTLKVQTGVTLTVNNILTVNTNAIPVFTGTGTGAINIAPAAVVNIAGSGVLTISSPLTFTLQSDITGSAAIRQMTNGLIVGTVNVQRYLTGNRGYRLISSPVYAGTASGNNIYSLNYLYNSLYLTGTGGTAGGFTAGGNPTIYLYDESFSPLYSTFLNSNFIGVSSISSGGGTSPTYTLNTNGAGLSGSYSIPAGTGFLCFFRGNASLETPVELTNPSYPALPATVTATGTLNQGQVVFKDWYTPTSSNLGSSKENFNLIGNPYASAIDLGTIPTATTTTGIYATPFNTTANTGITKFIYELNPVSHIFGVYTDDGSLPATNGASRYIASGEGFLVQAYGAASQFIFNETGKANSATADTDAHAMMVTKVDLAALNQGNTNPVIRLKLARDSVNNEEIVLAFNPSAKTQYVINEDAPNKPGQGKVGFSSNSSDNIQLVVNTMPLQKSQTINLNVYGQTNGLYTLNMAQVQALPAIYDVWLMDAYKNDSLDIKHNPAYSFNILNSDPASFGTNRFSLVIRQNPALMVRLLNFTATKATGGAQVVWTTENEQNYTNFTVERSTDGGVTFNALGGFVSGALGTYSFLDKYPPIAANQYRLKMEDLNGTITYSSIVTLMYANSGNSIAANNISVYPNPVTSTINLSIAQNSISASGSYKASDPPYAISIANSSGMIIKTASSSQTQWQDNLSNLLPGTYVIQVVNANDKTVVGKTKFIKL